MYNELELCEKIIEMYPEIGECGIDVDVEHDEQKNIWIVKLEKEEHELKHFLEYPDADNCMEGKQCVSLGLEIAQLRKNIEGKQF
jgi:hypothetical protein